MALVTLLHVGAMVGTLRNGDSPSALLLLGYVVADIGLVWKLWP